MRCVSAASPQVVHLSDSTPIGVHTRRWRTTEHPWVRLCLAWQTPAGLPCLDLLSLNKVVRKGLGGARSFLYREVVGLVKEERLHCNQFAEWLLFVKKVTSADSRELEVLTQCFEACAIEAVGGDLTWCRRPLVLWPDWEIQHEVGVTWQWQLSLWIAKLRAATMAGCGTWPEPSANVREVSSAPCTEHGCLRPAVHHCSSCFDEFCEWHLYACHVCGRGPFCSICRLPVNHTCLPRRPPPPPPQNRP